jgi:transcriptional regulator with XRE-family HTH domain
VTTKPKVTTKSKKNGTGKTKYKPRSTTEADVVLGLKLRAMRMDNSLSQADVGDHLGVSFQQIQKYEKGVNRVSMTRAGQLAALFGTTVKELSAADDAIEASHTFDSEAYKLAVEFSALPPQLKPAVRAMIAEMILALKKTGKGGDR